MSNPAISDISLQVLNLKSLHDTTENIEKRALEIIEEYKVINFKEIEAYLPQCRGTLYNHDLHKLDTIKTAIEKNRLLVKAGLRKKWYDSDNATVQIALYKLIADEDELTRLNSQKVEHSGEMKTGMTIHFDDSSVPIANSEDDVQE